MAIQGQRVGAVAQQQGANLAPTLGGRLMQGGELPQVHRVDIGTMPDEKLCHFKVSVRASIVQWHKPTLILGMDIRPVL